MGAGEGRQMLVPVRHLRADGIMDRHVGSEGAYTLADFGVFCRTFGGLGEDFDGLGEVDTGERRFQHGAVLHDDGVAVHLTQQAQDLGVADFPENEQGPVQAVRM